MGTFRWKGSNGSSLREVENGGNYSKVVGLEGINYCEPINSLGRGKPCNKTVILPIESTVSMLSSLEVLVTLAVVCSAVTIGVLVVIVITCRLGRKRSKYT